MIIHMIHMIAKSIKIPWLMIMFPIQRAQKCRGILMSTIRKSQSQQRTTYKPHPDGVLRSKRAQCEGFLK